MRSLGFTLLLVVTAAIICALAGLQWRNGNFDSIFGAPPTPVGQRIYDSFSPNQVKFIRIAANGTSASFALKSNGWQAASPWTDRMDPRAAVAIINFTLGMRVEDVAHKDEIDTVKVGLEEKSISIRLEDENRQSLAKYRIGRVSSWKADIDGREQPAPTLFVRTRDENHNDHVYLCTGDVTPLFKDGLKFLRDHRPFYFNPIALEKIRIRSQQGDLTLGRASAGSPWRIIKPLDLPTDSKAIKTLIEGIFELQAVKVSDRAATTLPASDNAIKTNQIALTPFGSASETILEIFPPDSPESRDVKAIVSDRPDTVFDIPIKPEPGLTSIADLPLAVNELRDPSLTHLNIQSLRSISIQPATGREILISRTPPQPWMASVDDQTFEANEENLFSLLKAVTTHRATDFVSDAATDFTPWGLDRPFLTLRFLGQDNKALEPRFGMDSAGSYFANRLATPTVMRVDTALIQAIAVRPYEWRHARLWSLDRYHLTSIIRQQAADAPLVLKYTFNPEAWTAERDGKDLTNTLNTQRANYMLSNLEGLKIKRWLATDDEGALTALATPSLTFTVFEKTVDTDDNDTGVSIRTLTLAPSPGNHPGFYYGQLNSETHPFLLDAQTYQKIAVDLFEE
jgi:hypothetical protein